MTVTREKAVVLLSGGLDSSVLAAHMKYMENRDVIGLSVNYGQRHSRELISANVVAETLGIEHLVIQAHSSFLPLFSGAESSQVGEFRDVPEGHYAAENMKTTIVPNRNMLLIAMAGALAVSRGAEAVCVAIHSGDHAIYPDCRPEFYHRMSQALDEATAPPVAKAVRVYAPFVLLSKADIVARGLALNQWNLMGLTWSCYREGLSAHCGKCGTCVERKEAFQLAGIKDPTEYEV